MFRPGSPERATETRNEDGVAVVSAGLDGEERDAPRVQGLTPPATDDRPYGAKKTNLPNGLARLSARQWSVRRNNSQIRARAGQPQLFISPGRGSRRAPRMILVSARLGGSLALQEPVGGLPRIP